VPHFHVSSSKNRESIAKHGLDWTRMRLARGVAGSPVPEQEGIFLCSSEFDAEFFLGFDNGDGPLDLWAVEGVEQTELIESPEGFEFVARPIPPSQVSLVRQDIEPPEYE
jgi:hypothetical protein